jgi:hypothetical protein
LDTKHIVHLIPYDLYNLCREGNQDKFSYMFTAYQDHVDRILESENYQAEFPTGLNKELMMRRTINGHDVLDGKSLWETNWETSKTYIKNIMLVIWLKIEPTTKKGVIRSGVENFEPALKELRKALFDTQYNSIALIQESTAYKPSPKPSSSKKPPKGENPTTVPSAVASKEKSSSTEKEDSNQEKESPEKQVSPSKQKESSEKDVSPGKTGKKATPKKAATGKQSPKNKETRKRKEGERRKWKSAL